MGKDSLSSFHLLLPEVWSELWEDHLQYCDQLAEDRSVKSGGKYPRAKVIIINTPNHQSKSKPTKQKWLWGKRKILKICICLKAASSIHIIEENFPREIIYYWYYL